MDPPEDAATASELKLFLESILQTLSKTQDAFSYGDLTWLEILERTLANQTGVILAIEAVLAEAVVDGSDNINVETIRQMHTWLIELCDSLNNQLALISEKKTFLESESFACFALQTRSTGGRPKYDISPS